MWKTFVTNFRTAPSAEDRLFLLQEHGQEMNLWDIHSVAVARMLLPLVKTEPEVVQAFMECFSLQRGSSWLKSLPPRIRLDARRETWKELAVLYAYLRSLLDAQQEDLPDALKRILQNAWKDATYRVSINNIYGTSAIQPLFDLLGAQLIVMYVYHRSDVEDVEPDVLRNALGDLLQAATLGMQAQGLPSDLQEALQKALCDGRVPSVWDQGVSGKAPVWDLV